MDFSENGPMNLKNFVKRQMNLNEGMSEKVALNSVYVTLFDPKEKLRQEVKVAKRLPSNVFSTRRVFS